jgi:flagellar biosynthesis protein FlhF
MKIKRFLAANMREAIRLVREEQGPEAVILSNQRVPGGVEVVAATDYDAALMQQATRRTTLDAAPAEPQPAPDARPAKTKDKSKTATVVAEPAPAAPIAPEIQQLRAEVGGMRRLLQEQLAGLAWRDLGERQPERMAALRAMSNLGIDAALAHDIVEALPQKAGSDRARFLPLGLLSRRIPIVTGDPILQGGVFALVGPTGVGKTTTIAKLAARWAGKFGTRDLALVTTDHYRVGAQEQLFTYGRLLGVPVHTAANGPELGLALSKLSDRKLVLIDTAGMSPRDQQLAAQFTELRATRAPIRSLLVLPATTQSPDLSDIIARFAPAQPEAAVLTKLDEATRIGGALSAAIRAKLPLAYLCDGQRVPEDLGAARADQLVLRAMQLARQHPATVDDAMLALQFGGAHGRH